jgi:hypothetical protein
VLQAGRLADDHGLDYGQIPLRPRARRAHRRHLWEELACCLVSCAYLEPAARGRRGSPSRSASRASSTATMSDARRLPRRRRPGTCSRPTAPSSEVVLAAAYVAAEAALLASRPSAPARSPARATWHSPPCGRNSAHRMRAARCARTFGAPCQPVKPRRDSRGPTLSCPLCALVHTPDRVLMSPRRGGAHLPRPQRRGARRLAQPALRAGPRPRAGAACTSPTSSRAWPGSVRGCFTDAGLLGSFWGGVDPSRWVRRLRRRRLAGAGHRLPLACWSSA